MALPRYVIKRDGSKERFNKTKIQKSIWTAARNVGGKDQNLANEIGEEVIEYIDEVYGDNEPIQTADVGSAVERVLVKRGHYATVKEFILSREKKRETFNRKEQLGVRDDIGNLSYNSLFILKERYLKKTKSGETKETPEQMLKRVARFVAKAEPTAAKTRKWEKKFFQIMKDWQFLPGTRVLANAGKKNAQLANCFVFDIDDNIESIFKTLYESSVTKRHGGGCGYNFSKLRPKGDMVAGEPGLAAGPIEIMKMFDLPTSIFRQQGRYESGNMAILNVDHPDILEFITCKEQEGVLTKTNISIGIIDGFMEAVKKDKKWELINPRTGRVVNRIRAKALWELAATYAHKTGDPGIIFLDNINKDNPLLEKFGPIQSTNVCGEIPQYPYESCNLGYLNLNSFLEKNKKGIPAINYEKLTEVAGIATRFMDNVIEASWFPVKEQTKNIRSFRRLGIGIVGWAEILVDLGLPYNDPRAFKLAEKVSKTIADACHDESMKIGKEKGPFPYVKYSKWAGKKDQPRNVAVNTLPPSSGNAVIFGTSFSIEPFFALAFYQNVLGGVRIRNVNDKLEQKLKEEGIVVENLFDRIFENHGSIQNMKEIPEKIRKLFLTAHELDWQDHLKIQAAWQKYVDNAITKTINMPSSATVDDVEKAYMMAWEMGCKGITIYRDQSKLDQVIEFGDQKKKKSVLEKLVKKQEKSMRQLRPGDDCPKCGSRLVSSEGCIKCLSCNFSLCTL
ncbi:adenosylcobalamin-dependent ribonucleoside-diphosphate reductase [Candidatus Dojkabacteria bacterium]|nr:adenosylcobalamin-dependent ribonucleoside-diphosphate reductase [Candidatus Dojkabacteria bacterium]